MGEGVLVGGVPVIVGETVIDPVGVEVGGVPVIVGVKVAGVTLVVAVNVAVGPGVGKAVGVCVADGVGKPATGSSLSRAIWVKGLLV